MSSTLLMFATAVPVVFAQDAVDMPPEEELSSSLGEFLPPDDSGEEAVFDFGDEGMEFERSSQELEQDFRKEAFDAALKNLLPLEPDEIRTVLERFDRTIESSNVPVHPYPRPESAVQHVSLDPGSAPLIVKLAYGYVTTLSILDSSGSPWPIEDISWVGDFEIMEDTVKSTTHLLRISPGGDFAHGNISLRLLGLDAPVVFTFETNRDLVHYRFDAIIPGNGPMAQTPLIDPGISIAAGDTDMATALAGMMPPGAKRLTVEGVDTRTTAFSYNDMTYVRTPLTLLSPGWDSSVASADGTRVYMLQETPVLLLSDQGRMVRAHLTEHEDL